MELYKIVGALLVLGATAFAGASDQRSVRRDLFVAAAASLSALAPQLTRELHESTGIDVRFNFAGSNTLARQIVEGARVDVFISADEAQMDLVDKAGRVVPGSRTPIVGNQLVVIASGSDLRAPFVIDALLLPRIRRVAMGDPEAVPAGVYGRQWLEAIRLWGGVQPKIVPLPSSPAVVRAVSEGRADIGIVYLSDVTAQGSPRIVHRVAPEDAPRIVYPAAAITGGRRVVADEFIAFLRSARAQAIFEAAGFRPLAAR